MQTCPFAWSHLMPPLKWTNIGSRETDHDAAHRKHPQSVSKNRHANFSFTAASRDVCQPHWICRYTHFFSLLRYSGYFWKILQSLKWEEAVEVSQKTMSQKVNSEGLFLTQSIGLSKLPSSVCFVNQFRPVWMLTSLLSEAVFRAHQLLRYWKADLY